MDSNCLDRIETGPQRPVDQGFVKTARRDQSIDIQACPPRPGRRHLAPLFTPCRVTGGAQQFDAMIVRFLRLSVVPGSMGEQVMNKERG